MTDSTLDLSQALDDTRKLLKIIDNGDGTYSIAVAGSVDLSSYVTSATATVTAVVSNAASVQLLALTAGRKQAMFYNGADKPCYLKLGTTASTSSYTVKMLAGSYYELVDPVYTGRVDGIWDADPTGSMLITELS